MKKLTLFMTALLFAAVVNAQSVATQKHEVQSGETLSSIARKYKTSVSSLLKLNPGMNADFVMAGQKINVPVSGAGQQVENASATVEQKPTAPVAKQQQSVPVTAVQSQQVVQGQSPVRPKYKTTHEVAKKETIFSISRQYGITEEQLVEANPALKKGKLKKGTILNIPYTTEEVNKFKEEQKKKEEEAKKPKITKYETIKAAVILPFALGNESMTIEAQKMANLYQGFLLAVDSLKRHGYSVDVYAFDELGNSEVSIHDILRMPVMRDMQLVVGPARPVNIAPVAKFVHEHGITHVVPLSNELALVNEHPTTFQVNIQYSLIYSQVYNRFIDLHKNDNIIFVGMNDKGDNVTYVIDFKMALDQKSIPYGRVSIAEFDKIRELLTPEKRNVVIPSSGSSAAFEALCKKLNSLKLSQEYSVQLFGYPEWQTFTTKHEKNLIKYNCQFFTSFYSNAGAHRTQQFNSRFRNWFNQEPYNSYPRYGELGYDIGAFFVKGLYDYGSAFYENIHNCSYQSLEFPFHFEKKNSWSGYQNKSMLIVTYQDNGSVIVR